MGLLSVTPSSRPKGSGSGSGSRHERLPLYNETLRKERYSDAEDSSDDDDGDQTDYSSTLSPSSRSSRQTSASMSSSIGLMKKPVPAAARRPAPRRYLYRLPNRVIRLLCVGMIMTIIIFMYGLVRASQVENRKLKEGKIDRPKVVTPFSGPVWEKFDFLKRYYGGIRTLKPFADNVPEYPRAADEEPYDANGKPNIVERPLAGRDEELGLGLATGKVPPSKLFVKHPGSTVPEAKGEMHECFVDAENKVRVPPIQYFDGRPDGFPHNVLGSYDLFGLPEEICFERYGRFGPYGFGYSTHTGGLGVGEHGDKEGSEAVWATVDKVNWNKVDWAATQKRCYQANADRFKPMVSRKSPPRGWYIGGNPCTTELKTREEASTPVMVKAEKPSAPSAGTGASVSTADAPRTAVVVRCWDEFWWNEEAVMSMRSLIAELSLASGGRYDVHLLVQVKNDAENPVWADDDVYTNLIKETIPAEFQGLVTLWTETQMLSLYQGLYDLYTRGPDLPVHGSYRGLQMAMQYFAYNHPEYDYFWQWEMDIRYTGHYLDLFNKLEKWAKEQPRKGLWERNARFYLPSVHGTWEDFKQMARVQTEIGTVGADNIWGKVPGAKQDPSQIQKSEQTVWGPQRPVDPQDWFEIENDPVPPTSYEKDKYVWGVGEEADLITLNPIFDPEGTTWGLAPDITGYNESDGIGKPPRRAQIITASRMSRKLLMTMHRETAFKKHHAFPEMWPATVALQHGFKAVYAPHPLFVDRAWPTEYMARIFNGGRNGASGGSRTSVFGDREHNMLGLSWFYNDGFAPNLYRRWLGLKVNNDGGEEFELTADASKDEESVSQMRGGEGRMCLPPILLHPIKEVELPVEETLAEETGGSVVVSDPSA